VVPPLAVLVPAAQPGDRPHAARRAPRGEVREPRRRLADREPPVAVEDQRGSGDGVTSAAVDEEQARSRSRERAIRGCVIDSAAALDESPATASGTAPPLHRSRSA
jgi:hypothetical protein